MIKNKILSYAAAVFVFASLLSCDEDYTEAPQTPFASFSTNSMDVGVPPESTLTREITIYTANKVGSDRNINLMVDESSTVSSSAYSIPSSIVIPANQNSAVIAVEFMDNGLEISEDQTLIIKAEQTDNFYVGQPVTFNVSKLCDTGLAKVKVTLELDDYPEEVYWSISDSDGNIVLASAIPASYGAYLDMEGEVKAAICLTPGVYTFEILDSYEDGAGSVNVTVDGSEAFASNGSYGAGTSATFTVE